MKRHDTSFNVNLKCQQSKALLLTTVAFSFRSLRRAGPADRGHLQLEHRYNNVDNHEESERANYNERGSSVKKIAK